MAGVGTIPDLAQHNVMNASHRLTLAIGFTQTLAWATTYYVPATVAGPAAVEFGLSRAVLVGGFTVGLLMAGLASPAIGRYIDRLGGRRVLMAAPVVTAIGQLILAASQGVVGWYAGWLVLGLGMALGLYDAAFGTIGRLLGSKARPTIVGVTLMAGFASTVGWPSGTYLVGQFGWRAAMLCFAAVQLLVILPVVAACVPHAPPLAPPKPAARDAPLSAMPRHAFAWMATYFTLRSAVNSIVFVHALVLLGGMGFGAGEAILAASLIGPAQVGARVIDWFAGQGLSPMISAVVGAVLLPLAVAGLLLGAPAAVFTLGFGMANGIFTITRGTLPMHVFGPDGYATMVGRLARPTQIAAALAPTLVAPLIGVWPAIWVMALIGVTGLVAVGCLMMLRR